MLRSVELVWQSSIPSWRFNQYPKSKSMKYQVQGWNTYQIGIP